MNNQAKKPNVQRARVDLLTQEKQYQLLNAELEAKTANLVSEADAVLREQANILAKPSLLDNVNKDDLVDWDRYDYDDSSYKKNYQSQLPPTVPHQRAAPVAKGLRKPATKKTAGVPTPRSARPKSVASSAATDDLSGHGDNSEEYTLNTAISNIEKRLENHAVSSGYDYDDDDDILPGAASEMAAEAQIRLLKAKLRVMQEEMDRVSQEIAGKDDRLREGAASLKEVEEERSRLQRTTTAQQTQTDKFKKLLEESKVRADGLDIQLAAARKELDVIKRNQKQQTTNQGATEVLMFNTSLN